MKTINIRDPKTLKPTCHIYISKKDLEGINYIFNKQEKMSGCYFELRDLTRFMKLTDETLIELIGKKYWVEMIKLQLKRQPKIKAYHIKAEDLDL